MVFNTAPKPSQDYGVDLVVEISEEREFRGLEFIIQFKASQHPSNNTSDTETIRLNTSTFNFLKEKLQVVILLKGISKNSLNYVIFY